MRAGNLDRTITIDAYAPGPPDEYGGGESIWTAFKTVRAQVVTMSTEEYLRAYGESAETAIVFRIRFTHGVTASHRIGYQGRHYNIREIKEMGRRRGIELRCDEVRG